VVLTEGGAARSFSADHLICAIPFSVLQDVEVSPPFSAEKLTAIAELPYTSVTRVFLQSKKKRWIEDGVSGWAATDLPLGLVWDTTFSYRRDERGILQAYSSGESARNFCGMGEDERIGLALEHMEKVHPGFREDFETGASWCWDEDEWSRGGYCWFRPGQMTALLPYIARPEGRVHFAGEHASAWPAWMQGALASGLRAAREVNESA
jgi:monoamine oxidase